LSDGDEIVFGEVRYREPVRMRRPDRDRRFACVAYEVPGPGDLPVFLDRGPADAIERHALRDTSVELGGILLGRECVDDETGEPFVWVTESLEAKHYENTQASFTYTHDSWEEITRERDRLHPDLDIVGWYHTHPDFGIFLSSHDLFIHRNFFNQPLQVAYVVDPIRQTRGFFRWRADALDQVGGFYLTADRGQRQALVRLVNDLEGIPNADGGGGGLSPRLEAELIAMLSRPSYQSPPASDRATIAAMGSIVGVLAGVLGLSAVLWINNLTAQLREQAGKVEDLRVTLRDNTDTQRMALDALLKRSEPGAAVSGTMIESYKKSLRDLDDSRAKADSFSSLAAKLEQEVKTLSDEEKSLKSRLAKAEEKAKENESEAKLAKDLRGDLAQAKEQIARQNATIATKTEQLEATGDSEKAAALVSRARWGTYLAIAGWVVAILLGVALAALWAHAHPIPEENATPPPAPGEAPHVIT
jgi:proteasome lid subunit RPN8/RPN11